MLKAFSLALALTIPGASFAVGTNAFDACEEDLRGCFATCTADADTCNRRCTTEECDDIPGAWKTLTEFLAWRRTHGRIAI